MLSPLLGLSAGACAPPAAQPSQEIAGFEPIRRLELEPLQRAPERLQQLATVALFDPLDERDRWDISYDKSRARSKRTAEQSAPILWIEGTTPHLVRSLEGIAEFNQIALSVIGTTANKDVALKFRKDGETILSTGRKRFGAPHAQTVLFDLPFHGEAPDEIELVFTSAWRSTMHIIVGIESIALLKRPLIDWLPAAQEGAALVRIGAEGRRAVGLSSAAPLRAQFTPRPGEQLRFSFGVPEIVQGRDQGASFRIRLSTDGHDAERSFEIAPEEDPLWHDATIELEAFNGKPTELLITLEMNPEGKDCVIALGEPSLSAPSDSPPSVLLLTSDTHRGDHIGAAPNSVGIETPFLDELAAAGMHFVDCWSPTNITLPAHVSLFTGVSPRDTGIVNNMSALAPDAMTLAEHFHAAGYETFAAVSITHLSFNTSGPGQGFDRMNVAELPLDSSETFALASRWIEDSSQRPLFLWVHIFDAHAPYLPPEEYRRLYYPEDLDPFDKDLERLGQRVTPSWLKGLRDLKYPQALYRSEITYLDTQLRGFYSGSRFEQGLVVMTADHGESLGEHNIWFEHKGLFPNTLCVPLIIKGPGVPAHVTSTSPVTLLDIGRTMLDLGGLANAVHPGRNLLELHETPSDEPRFSLAAHGAEASVTLGPWHLVLHLMRPSDSRYERHQVRLYHLGQDPACLDDLAGGEPSRSRRLRTMLVEWLLAAQPVGWNVLETAALDADELEALESLGYATGERSTRSNEWIDAACKCEHCETHR